MTIMFFDHKKKGFTNIGSNDKGSNEPESNDKGSNDLGSNDKGSKWKKNILCIISGLG